MKARHPSTTNKLPRAARPHSSSAADIQEQLDQRTRELAEALERQDAAGDILRIIASSPKDAQPVFDSIARSAARLCHAQFCHVFRYDGELIHFAAHHGLAPEGVEAIRRAYPIPPGRASAAARAILNSTIEQIPDVHADPDYKHGRLAHVVTYSSTVAVPMLKDGRPIGAISVARSENGYFPERQVELLRIFADQAVIAIENVRLLNAEQQRTRELSEALEQQTATAEVLQVINSSPGALAPVFEAMLEKAMHLCEAAFGGLWMFEEDRYVAVALRGVPQAYAAFLAKTTVIPGRGTAPYRLLHGERLVHNIDLASEEPYRAGDPQRRALVDLGGARTALQVALRKEDAVLGVITIYRQQVRPFSNKHIALLQNFAAQAVIAIENTRLLNELRESLQQQTATSEVLRVISSSPGDLEPVFLAILENATRMCTASFGNLFLREGDRFRLVALHGAPTAWAEWWRREPLIRPGPRTGLGRIARTKKVVHIADLTKEQAYIDRDPLFVRQVELAGGRTLLVVPMLKDEELIGAIGIFRQEVQPFTGKQIELVKSFASQAVIAIENTRLLSELRESLQQQTCSRSSAARPSICRQCSTR
jgi:GAF domain-containing protein